jgi:hypothetical protein
MKLPYPKSQQEMFDIVVTYFNSTNRGIDDFNLYCYYLSPTGTKCAIGIFLNDNLCEQLNIEAEGTAVNNPEIFKKLPSKLQKLSKNFLVDMQLLHDAPDFWNEKGITELGKEKATDIAKRYNLTYDPQ